MIYKASLRHSRVALKGVRLPRLGLDFVAALHRPALVAFSWLAGQALTDELGEIVGSGLRRLAAFAACHDVSHLGGGRFAYPPAIFQDLAWYVACHCADEYMEEGEASSFRSKNEERSLAELRRLTASTERTDMPTRADFF